MAGLNRIGFDAWGRGPSAADAKAAGVDFRTAYASFDASKDLSAADCAAYGAQGIVIAVNFETTINRVFGGYAAGKSDMLHSIAEYKPRGMPEGAVVILSADEEISTGSFGQVLPYYQGAFDAAAGHYRTGCYGEQALIAYLKSHGVIQIGWKSMSLSFPGGGTEALCDIVQTRGGTIAGHSIDWNVGKVPFLGGWTPGRLEGSAPSAPAPIPAPKPVAAPVHDAAWRAAHNTYTPLTTDGRFGPATVKAVQFVTGGVTVDGAWGPASKISLQKHLGVSADGVVGPGTIRALQKRVGATADGVWGSGTTGALQRALNAGRF